MNTARRERRPILTRLINNLRADLHRAILTLTRRRVISRYVATHATRKLHIGCGPNLLDGWLNTDISGRLAIRMNATRRFPFEDNTFDYVFSEHMIEHIEYPEALFMLEECHRVLKPGGRIRVATPDLETLLRLYCAEPTANQRHYIEWSTDKYLPEAEGYRAAYVINQHMRGLGHLFIFDEESLRTALEKTGFRDVVRWAPGESSDDALKRLERHGEAIGNEAINRFETLVVEAGA